VGAIDALKDVIESRDLIRSFTRREIRVRYKQTLLGLAWAVAHPLALMLIFTLVFSRFVGVSSEGYPYPLFSYAALLPWTFFSTATTLAMRSLVNNVELVTKVWFPREVLPASSVLASVFDFAISLSILALLMLWYGTFPGWSVLWVLPLIALQLVLTTGMSLFVAAINVRYRDVKFIVPLGLQVWLYASPVIYSVTAVPESIRPYYALNPMVGLIDGYRAVLLAGGSPNPYYLGVSVAGACLFLFFGWWYFHRVEAYFADVI